MLTAHYLDVRSMANGQVNELINLKRLAKINESTSTSDPTVVQHISFKLQAGSPLCPRACRFI